MTTSKKVDKGKQANFVPKIESIMIILQEAKESFSSPDYLFHCSGHTGELG